MRFSQQIQTGYAARLPKLMPHGLADDAEIEIPNDLFAYAAYYFDFAKKVG